MAKLRLKGSKLNFLLYAAFLVIIVRALISSVIDDYSQLRAIQISSYIIIGLCLIIFAVLHKEKTSILARIGFIVEALSWSVLPFAPDLKSYYLFYTLIMWSCVILFALSCVSPFGDKEGRAVATAGAFFTLFDFLTYFRESSYYEYANNSGSIHFWLPTLIVTLVGVGITVILILKDKIPIHNEKNNTKGGKASIIIIAVFVLLGLTWSSAEHLNFALDTSEPIVYEETIVEKRKSGGKSTSYYFYVEIDGEEYKMNVSSNTYREYEEGDTFKILYYEGAFNDPFYTY